MEPATGMMIAAAIQAASSIGGGMLSKGGNKETKMQRQKRKLIDDLLASLKGGGSFNDLFQNDPAAFQKGIVDPAMSRYRNKIAPGIQQGYVNSGLQRGTGLDDSLARAGIDLQSEIDSKYLDFYQQGQANKMSMINSILGGGDGAQQPMSGGQAAAQAGAGFLSSDSFANAIDKILGEYTKEKPMAAASVPQPGQPGWETTWEKRPGSY